MALIWDEPKRAETLASRGLDFADAGIVFEGSHFTVPSVTQDHGEPRFLTAGEIAGRMVIIVWTPRGGDRRIISMRKANEQEQRRYRQRLGKG